MYMSLGGYPVNLWLFRICVQQWALNTFVPMWSEKIRKQFVCLEFLTVYISTRRAAIQIPLRIENS